VPMTAHFVVPAALAQSDTAPEEEGAQYAPDTFTVAAGRAVAAPRASVGGGVTVRVIDGTVELNLHATGIVRPAASTSNVQLDAEMICLPVAFGNQVPARVTSAVPPLATPPCDPAVSATGVAPDIENVLMSVMAIPVLFVKTNDNSIGTLLPTRISDGTVKVKDDGPACAAV
jgi:hypothetical protein